MNTAVALTRPHWWWEVPLSTMFEARGYRISKSGPTQIDMEALRVFQLQVKMPKRLEKRFRITSSVFVHFLRTHSF